MSSITIKDANTGAKLEFLDVNDQYFTVSFSSASLSASHRVWAYSRDYEWLVGFFLDMAQNWTGWTGAKTWEPIEGGFSLSSTSDFLGHITLDVELVGRDAPELWSVKFKVKVEAGQLETIANQMKRLFEWFIEL